MLTAKNEGMDTRERQGEPGATPTTFRQWCTDELRPAVETNFARLSRRNPVAIVKRAGLC